MEADIQTMSAVHKERRMLRSGVPYIASYGRKSIFAIKFESDLEYLVGRISGFGSEALDARRQRAED